MHLPETRFSRIFIGESDVTRMALYEAIVLKARQLDLGVQPSCGGQWVLENSHLTLQNPSVLSMDSYW